MPAPRLPDRGLRSPPAARERPQRSRSCAEDPSRRPNPAGPSPDMPPATGNDDSHGHHHHTRPSTSGNSAVSNDGLFGAIPRAQEPQPRLMIARPVTHPMGAADSVPSNRCADGLSAAHRMSSSGLRRRRDALAAEEGMCGYGSVPEMAGRLAVPGNLVDALREELFSSLTCHREIEPHAVPPGPGPVQPDGGPGEHTGQDVGPAGWLSDTQGEGDGYSRAPDGQHTPDRCRSSPPPSNTRAHRQP